MKMKEPMSLIQFVMLIFWIIVGVSFVVMIAFFAAEVPAFANMLRWFAGTCLFFLVSDLLIEAAHYLRAMRRAVKKEGGL